MNLIVAVSENWGIGRGNDLLFHISEDLKYFRRMTEGKTLILGRRNLESFPGCRPLPRRRHLVLTGQADWKPEGVEVYHSMEEIFDAVRNLSSDEVWVVGGGVVYREFLPYCRKAYVTHIDACPEAEVFFPDLTAHPDWKCTEPGEIHYHDDTSYRFSIYENQHPQTF